MGQQQPTSSGNASAALEHRFSRGGECVRRWMQKALRDLKYFCAKVRIWGEVYGEFLIGLALGLGLAVAGAGIAYGSWTMGFKEISSAQVVTVSFFVSLSTAITKLLIAKRKFEIMMSHVKLTAEEKEKAEKQDGVTRAIIRKFEPEKKLELAEQLTTVTCGFCLAIFFGWFAAYIILPEKQKEDKDRRLRQEVLSLPTMYLGWSKDCVVNANGIKDPQCLMLDASAKPVVARATAFVRDFSKSAEGERSTLYLLGHTTPQGDVAANKLVGLGRAYHAYLEIRDIVGEKTKIKFCLASVLSYEDPLQLGGGLNQVDSAAWARRVEIKLNTESSGCSSSTINPEIAYSLLRGKVTGLRGLK